MAKMTMFSTYEICRDILGRMMEQTLNEHVMFGEIQLSTLFHAFL